MTTAFSAESKRIGTRLLVALRGGKGCVLRAGVLKVYRSTVTRTPAFGTSSRTVLAALGRGKTRKDWLPRRWD